jgi:hypothetical protein
VAPGAVVAAAVVVGALAAVVAVVAGALVAALAAVDAPDVALSSSLLHAAASTRSTDTEPAARILFIAPP